MIREDALAALSSDDTDERLRSARYFAMHATSGDRRRIQLALKRETVPWIKRALERAVVRAAKSREVVAAPSKAIDHGDLTKRQVVEQRTDAIYDVAGSIMHELSPLLGQLRIAASIEVPEYAESRTSQLLESLNRLLQGIRNLKSAASSPTYEDCDLSSVCRSICGVYEQEANILYAGPTPFPVELDPNLLELALSNIVRNSIDAMPDTPPGDRIITLNWGRAGKEYWMSVLDNGPGFENEPNSMVELGKTTKKGAHIGFGLGNAKQAMQAMEGDLYPATGVDGGAKVELRWFSDDENPIR